MLNLSPAERRSLRANAHSLNPVVMIGQQGLTEAVLREIDIALKAHELIKVRVFNDERDEREAMLQTICDKLDCAAVQHLGKLLLLWRPQPASSEPKRRRVAVTADSHADKKKRPAKKTSRLIDHRGHLIGAPLSTGKARRMGRKTEDR